MISVLIPVYNTQVVSLVGQLSDQLSNLNVAGEIIVIDDYSSASWRELNLPIKNLPKVQYKELESNYGRTAIRQFLASSARYEWLLFLDNDSRILSNDFLQKYISTLEMKYDIVVGGRVYSPKPPDCEKILHWKYGAKREAIKGNKTVLHTNNFCIRREIFQQLKFPTFLNRYGHEDTWMEIELERLQKRVVHIDNPVEHVNLENTADFLNKTHQALQNLLLLKDAVEKKQLINHVSLFSAYDKVKKFGLSFIIDFFYRSFKERITRNLRSCKPSLLVFDLYRLYHFIQLSKQN